MKYIDIVQEVIDRVNVQARVQAKHMKYEVTFKEALERFLCDLEDDVLVSFAAQPMPMTEDTLADAEFEKKLDEELAGEAIYKGSWVD